jgi:hypothetical protein
MFFADKDPRTLRAESPRFSAAARQGYTAAPSEGEFDLRLPLDAYTHSLIEIDGGVLVGAAIVSGSGLSRLLNHQRYENRSPDGRRLPTRQPAALGWRSPARQDADLLRERLSGGPLVTSW